MEDNHQLNQALQYLINTLTKGSSPNNIPAEVLENLQFQILLENFDALRRFGLDLSNGDLSASLNIKGPLAGSLKNHQATLSHLTWQTQMIAQGDFTQRVDFMGEFSIAFNQMVEKLEKARTELKKSEAVYRSMFENNRAVQLLVDSQDGKIVDANPAACSFYGFSRDQLRQKSIFDIQLSPSKKIEDFLANNLADNHTSPLVVTQKLASDETRTVEIYSSPIEISERILLYTIIHNITERNLAEEALQYRMRQVEALQIELREQAIRDPLTGLYNRRYWKEIIDHELKRATRTKSSIGVIMVDIDHFKIVNDTFGHPMGDQVLEALGRLLINNIRGADIACRFGGEEFILLLPDCDRTNTIYRAELLRSKFQALEIHENNQKVSATISLGIAMFPEHGMCSAELLTKADQALYTAKNKGRNRVDVYADQQAFT